MEIGQKYDEKDGEGGLLEAIGKLVFFNKKFQTKSDNIQKALKDIVESLWDRSGGGGCDTAEYTQIVENATITISRQICGDKVLISGRVTQPSYSGNPGEVRVEVIPQDFLNKTWFKATRVVMLLTDGADWGSAVTTGVGSLGYLYVNQFSSTIDDASYLVMDGSAPGSGRTYNIDGFHGGLGPNTGIVDSDNDNTANYIANSPLDLRQQPLIVGFDNAETKGSVVDSLSNIDWKFTIEGTLI